MLILHDIMIANRVIIAWAFIAGRSINAYRSIVVIRPLTHYLYWSKTSQNQNKI